MMLGLLLARAGIDVVVLEKHGDFLRDFRGDTVHPSTLQVMHELGLLDAFLARPHSEVRSRGAPMDVLWLRLSRRLSDPGQTLGHVDAGRFFVMLDRNDYWQCAFVIPKGAIDEVRARGLDAFRADIVRLAPYLQDRVHELTGW